jgi:hypothetical protein
MWKYLLLAVVEPIPRDWLTLGFLVNCNVFNEQQPPLLKTGAEPLMKILDHESRPTW